ncbi:class I SAM-dependent methyltransferase [Vitreimonas sp.]|uniref:class I SAM-dependent methyltransferase n=1 Tax=Vitreimonas sp. TaxID=3069702 RepID=UPI002EDB39E1
MNISTDASTDDEPTQNAAQKKLEAAALLFPELSSQLRLLSAYVTTLQESLTRVEALAEANAAGSSTLDELIGEVTNLNDLELALITRQDAAESAQQELGTMLRSAAASHQETLVHLVENFGRLDETMVAFGGRMDQGSAAVQNNIADLTRGFARIDETLVALGERLDQSNVTIQTRITDLTRGFARVDETLVALGDRLDRAIGIIAARLDALDHNMVQGFEIGRSTLWEVQAALAAQMKELPQALVDAGVGVGGGGGQSDDGVPVGEMIFPRAARDDVVTLDLAQEVGRFGLKIAEHTNAATSQVLELLPGRDLSAMGRNSPELRNLDWAPYISLSAIRVAHTLDAVERFAPRKAKVLDFGAYFGNFSIAMAHAGHQVDALDAYGGAFSGALEPFAEIMRTAGVNVIDVADVGYDLMRFGEGHYDVVLFMGAIEHVPHTPRQTLEAITRVLKRGGVLVLDTPNLGYVYNRKKFISGKTVFPPIEHQFEAEPPFFGHHREYLPDEIRWMLKRVGHEVLDERYFNYSGYGMSKLRGEHLALWRLTDEHPQLRELIFTVSRRPA